AESASRRLARLPVSLGRVTPSFGAGLPCQSGSCPVSGAHALKALCRARFRFAAIAQLVEHVIRNDGVGGSNPSCGTIFKKSLSSKLTYKSFRSHHKHFD